MASALELIARVARVDAGTLAPTRTLGELGLGTSFGLSLLQSAIERQFQRKLRPLTWKMTVGELLVVLAEENAGLAAAPVASSATERAQVAPKPAAAVKTNGPFGGRTRVAAAPAVIALGHGVDIQEIAAMPATDSDYAEAFFRDHFAEEELAGARLRPDARAHLCGLWCAKEAVKKSDPALLPLTPLEIILFHAADGRPQVRLARADLEATFSIVVSISHSAAYAVASVITRRRW